MRYQRRYRYVYRRVNGHSPTGEELRDIGMARAEAAVPDWSALAKHTIYHVYNPLTPPFDSEILTGQIGKPRGEQDKPYKNNAVGSIFNGAAKRGIIVQVDRTNAQDPRSHANNHKVWRHSGKVFVSKVPCPYCPGYI